jgi:hypothetical protein
MDNIKIPKFDNETDEANWAYEHREDLAAVFINQHRQREEKPSLRLETALEKALQSEQMVVTPEELTGRSLVAVLRGRLAKQ